MDPEAVKEYYRRPDVLDHYTRAATSVGLWLSEEKIFTRLFKKDDRLLELGTGAGRIAFGLEELGYQFILAIDLSKEMVTEARRLGRINESRVIFQTGDARKLKFSDNEFDGAIFGFNGLMQIPGRENRHQALREIHRLLKPGSWFAFTTHDREKSKHRTYWEEQKKIWDRGEQNPLLDDFGDRYEDTPMGRLFIHVPSAKEIREDLKATGWRIEADALRSQIANESLAVRDFSDDCRFWVAQKPLA